jgi:hypothetical protein
MPLAVKNQYLFTFVAPAVLGHDITATLAGVMDYDTASTLQTDLVAKHAEVYPLCAAGTPIKAADLDYYKIKTAAGEVRIIAKQWLTTEPTLLSMGTITAVITGVSSADQQLLTDLLAANFVDKSFTVNFK